MSSSPPEPPERFSLSRWSRRKREAAREKDAPATPASEVAAPAAPVAGVAAPVSIAPAPVEPLPPVETLTIDSDFRAYLAPKVDEDIKRAALKKLFSDPHFNVMDGLDIYIGDYTQPDPMPEGMLEKLADVYKTLTEETAEKAGAESAAIADASVDAAPEAAAPEVAAAATPEPAAPPPPDENPA